MAILIEELFQWLSILSVPFIVCFFWYHYDLRLMKLAGMQYYLIILYCFSVIVNPKRSIQNYWPALFLLLAVFNIFTHHMITKTNLPFIWLPVLGFYSLINTISLNTIQLMKKAIVITCLMNCALFITQLFHMNIILTIDPIWDSHAFTRPCGIMCYPFEFATLCAVSSLFAWEWRKWLCVPIVGCLLMSYEFAPVFALGVICWIGFNKKWKIISSVIAIIIIACLWNLIMGKLNIRLPFLSVAWQLCFSHLIIGQGLGAFENEPSNLFPVIKGNWYELHCEPLDIFLCMGIGGILWAFGFIRDLCGKWNIYTKSFSIIGIVSLFQSSFHFMDMAWLCVILYIMFNID